MLQEAAKQMKSGILATAAAATMGSEAVQDVIAALDTLLDRLKEDQKMEKEHKDWCEDEISAARQKKEHAQALIAELDKKMEKEHKDWCEDEISAATQKKEH